MTSADDSDHPSIPPPSPTIPCARANGEAPRTPSELIRQLEELGIAHHTVSHPRVYTVEESRTLRGEQPGGHSKNLFLRNKKGGMWLITLQEERIIDLKSLGERLGAGRLSFASAERLMRYLGVTPGAVTPFAVVNDVGQQVMMVLDTSLLDHDVVHFHPLDNSMTTSLAPEDLLKFLTHVSHSPVHVRF